MEIHNYIQSGFLLVMQFIFALHNYGNYLVTMFKTHFILYALAGVKILRGRLKYIVSSEIIIKISFGPNLCLKDF
jgi:hypothetical protein